MPRKYWLMFALAGALVNGSCNETTVKPDENEHAVGKPGFVHHPAPEGRDMSAPFSALNCPKSDYGNGFKPCGPLAQFGCSEISPLDKASSGMFAAFQPAYPLALCRIVADGRPEPKEGEYVSVRGGLLREYYRYVMAKDGKFALLKNKAAFQQQFLPLDDGFEALAYAQIMTPYFAAYNFRYDDNERYFVKTIEDSYAKPGGDGYDLLMYAYSVFGCGNHPTYAVKLHISKAGKITETGSQTKVSESKVEICAD
jgi:hypothetical protein